MSGCIYNDGKTKVTLDDVEFVSIVQKQKTDVCVILSRAAMNEIVRGYERELKQEYKRGWEDAMRRDHPPERNAKA